MKILEAEKLHQLIIPAARIIPIMPLENKINIRYQFHIFMYNYLYIYPMLQLEVYFFKKWGGKKMETFYSNVSNDF